MDTTEQQPEQGQEPPAKVKSVSADILSQYFDALEREEGFADIAPKLRKVVLDDGVIAEPSIRAALLPNVS